MEMDLRISIRGEDLFIQIQGGEDVVKSFYDTIVGMYCIESAMIRPRLIESEDGSVYIKGERLI